MLSTDTLASLLPHKTLHHSLFVFDSIPSTNTLALELAKQDVPHATLVLADQQTAGRGRMDRQWFSPPGTNIYGSLILHTKARLSKIGWIPLAAGLAIAKTLDLYSGTPIFLKWPNDILISGKKVGGILCETSGSARDNQSIVVGFGINVNLLLHEFSEDLQKTATSLLMIQGQEVDRHSLIAELATSLEDYWEKHVTQGHHDWKQDYHKRCSTIGQIVRAKMTEGKTIEGRAEGIGDLGQLYLTPLDSSDSSITKTPNPKIEIHSGEIIHLTSY